MPVMAASPRSRPFLEEAAFEDSQRGLREDTYPARLKRRMTRLGTAQ